jgi:hypothetical protein
MSSGSPPSPSKAPAIKHLARARRFHQAYQRLKNGQQDLDWAVIVLFYTDLHLLQAYFVETASNAFQIPRTHDDRRTRVGVSVTPLFQHYRTLEGYSKDARYDPDYAPPTAEEVQELEDLDFRPIVNEFTVVASACIPEQTLKAISQAV